MHRFHLRPSTFFRIFVAVVTFALGLGAVGIWPRPGASPGTPPAAVAAGPPAADPARATVSVRDTPANAAEDEEEDAVFEGRYANYVYGYSVDMPAGMVGVGSTPPAPQHGFVIDLDNPRSTAWFGQKDSPESYLSVDGSYNSFDWQRLGDAANSNLKWLREKGQNVRVRSRALTRLGSLPALRVVVDYERGGVEMVNDEIVAFRTEGADPSPVYRLDLVTPLSKYERNRPALEATQKGWCLQPIE